MEITFFLTNLPSSIAVLFDRSHDAAIGTHRVESLGRVS